MKETEQEERMGHIQDVLLGGSDIGELFSRVERGQPADGQGRGSRSPGDSELLLVSGNPVQLKLF